MTADTMPRYAADLLAAKADEECCYFIGDSGQAGTIVLYRESGWLVVKHFAENAVEMARVGQRISALHKALFAQHLPTYASQFSKICWTARAASPKITSTALVRDNESAKDAHDELAVDGFLVWHLEEPADDAP